jgi:hypothetical protein
MPPIELSPSVAERQVTDRYTRAVEQLGSGKLDVRIGSVYALERIARDSLPGHPAVMEVLAAFIRENSHLPWPLAATAVPRRDRFKITAPGFSAGHRSHKGRAAPTPLPIRDRKSSEYPSSVRLSSRALSCWR